VRTQSKKGKGKRSPKNIKIRKKGKRNIDTQADYYYPGKAVEPKKAEVVKLKNDYSLRKRNRTATKKYVEESEEDEILSDEIYDKNKNNEVHKEDDEKDAVGMPKKPLSSYIFFSQQIRDQIRKNNPQMSVNELMKEISARWQKASENEKTPFNELALQDKKRYEDELNLYKKSTKAIREEKDKDPVSRKRSVNDFSNKSPRDMSISRSELIYNAAARRQNSNKFAVNVDQLNNPVAGVRKKERRTKKYFDNQYSMPPNNDEFVNPPNNDYYEARSLSNNRMEDKGTERSKQDSLMFPFNEDDDKDGFMNKDSPPDNDYMPFARNQPEPEVVFGDDLNRPVREINMVRQDSNKFPQMDMAMFSSGNFNNDPATQRQFSSSYRNYDGPPNDSNMSFKGDPMDFNDPVYGRAFNQPFGNGYNNPIDFKFGNSNQMGSLNRIQQNSFNNPFGDQPRNQVPQDYFSGNMNPNIQYSGAMNNQMGYYPPMVQRRPNTDVPPYNKPSNGYGNNKR
jgi:hypothetical protein